MIEPAHDVADVAEPTLASSDWPGTDVIQQVTFEARPASDATSVTPPWPNTAEQHMHGSKSMRASPVQRSPTQYLGTSAGALQSGETERAEAQPCTVTSGEAKTGVGLNTASKVTGHDADTHTSCFYCRQGQTHLSCAPQYACLISAMQSIDRPHGCR